MVGVRSWAGDCGTDAPSAVGGGVTSSHPSSPQSSPSERRAELNRKLRAAFIAGAEEQSMQAMGRGLTEEELQRVLRRYPGDLPDSPTSADPALECRGK